MTSFSHNARREGEARYRQMLEQAPSFIWKRFADGVSLRMRMFAPRGHRPEHFAPAVMFFCGGMWSLDYSTEFVSWAVHLAHRGIVCLLPEYRIFYLIQHLRWKNAKIQRHQQLQFQP